MAVLLPGFHTVFSPAQVQVSTLLSACRQKRCKIKLFLLCSARPAPAPRWAPGLACEMHLNWLKLWQSVSNGAI